MRKFFSVIIPILLLLTSCTTHQQAINTPDGATMTETTRSTVLLQPSPSDVVTNTPLTTDESENEIEMMPGCTIMSIEPTESSKEDSLFGLITEDDWVIGPATATVTLLEYSDFQCPGCATIAPVLKQITEEFPQDVRFVFRHFPLMSVHDKAGLAAQAAEAAGQQDKFWEMHDLLFAHQNEWNSKPVEEFKTWLSKQAEDLGLEIEKFEKDLESPKLQRIVQNAWQAGQELGIPSTPFLVANGSPWQNLPADYESIHATFSTMIMLTKLEERQYNQCPPMIIETQKVYVATLETTKGNLVIELFADKSPLTVNNFVFLAREGWYDGVPFHRVVPDFVAQTGDPSGTGFGGPGYAFINENSPELVFDEAGLVAMANSGPDMNGSQFFITFVPLPDLNGSFTIFGRLLEGMDVLKNLTLRNPQDGPPLPDPDYIVKVTIAEK